MLNLAPQPGETDGMTPAAHLRVLRAHAPDLRLAVVLVDGAAVPPDAAEAADLAAEAAALGARVVRADLSAGGDRARHDPAKLSGALHAVLVPSAPVQQPRRDRREVTWRR